MEEKNRKLNISILSNNDIDWEVICRAAVYITIAICFTAMIILA